MKTRTSELRVLKMPSVRCGLGELREATTGRVVTMLPRVWAVGVDGSLQRQTYEPQADQGTEGQIFEVESTPADDPDATEEVAFYRKYTEALLRRYQRMRLSTGRVPSPMDREMFRGRMSHYRVQGFEDGVIFCVDVEKCLQRLNGEDLRLVRRVAVQEYSMGEAAGMLGVSLRSCIVLYRRALDRLTRMFLEARLLEPVKNLSRGAGGPDRGKS